MIAWETIDLYLKARGVRVGAPTPSQTTAGTHVPTSYHYRGLARDYGRTSDAAAIARLLLPLAVMPFSPIVELFYTPLGIFVKNGVRFTPSEKLSRDHVDHVHVSVKPGIDLRKYIPGAAAIGGAVLAVALGIFAVRALAAARG